MAWTLGGVRIFAQESRREAGRIMPRLQPLNGGTVIQSFGFESPIHSVNALVVGDTDRDALMAMAVATSNYTLVSPEGSMGSFSVRKANYNRIPNICQTLRTDLPEDAPMYNFDFELYPA